MWYPILRLTTGQNLYKKGLYHPASPPPSPTEHITLYYLPVAIILDGRNEINDNVM